MQVEGDILDIGESIEVVNKKERDQLKKELYNLRKAVWSLILAGNWAEIERLMGDWYPGKEDNSGEISAERETNEERS